MLKSLFNRGLSVFLTCTGCITVTSPQEETFERSSSKIIHGDVDAGILDRWSGVVTLRGVRDESTGESTSCTATALAPTLFLTARHCISHMADDCTFASTIATKDIYFFRGSQPSGTPSAVGKRVVFPPSERCANADIALVVTDRPLMVSTYPVSFRAPLTRGLALDIAGFGLDIASNLTPGVFLPRKARYNVPIMGVGPIPSQKVGTREFIVGESTCAGDSGAAAFLADIHAVVGVHSRGANGSPPQPQAPWNNCYGETTVNWFVRVDAIESELRQVAKEENITIEERTSVPTDARCDADCSEPPNVEPTGCTYRARDMVVHKCRAHRKTADSLIFLSSLAIFCCVRRRANYAKR